jgi:hypothetical protein
MRAAPTTVTRVGGGVVDMYEGIAVLVTSLLEPTKVLRWLQSR